MIALDVAEDVLVERLLGRAAVSGRADDADEGIIRNRISVYNNQTAPVAGHYEAAGKFRKVDGIGAVDEITERLFAAIDSF
jgi:adenylate kinase